LNGGAGKGFIVFTNIRDRLGGRRLPVPSPAMIVALVALFVALGGSAYAALNLPANSVGTRQLKNAAVTRAKLANGAVTSRKVKDHSLLARDFRRGQLPAGPQGPAGPAGPSDSFTSYASDVNIAAVTRIVHLGTLNLPSGSFFAFARANVQSALSGPQEVVCALGTPGFLPNTIDTSQATDTSRIELAPNDEQSITLAGPITLSSAATVTFDCNQTGANTGDTGTLGFRGIQVSAIKVGLVHFP
jgi:hypothetical protein